jgi:hypothetical protein
MVRFLGTTQTDAPDYRQLLDDSDDEQLFTPARDLLARLRTH